MHDETSLSRSAAAGAEVASGYDRWAASYDADENATRDLDAAVLRSAGLPVQGQDVVELGCGTGKNTVWLAAHARSVVALDFSQGMLARARSRVADPRTRFVHQDITARWPLGDGTADLVVGNLVLEHVTAVAAIYGEAVRVLRPGGTLFVCELHPERQRRGGQAHFADEAGRITHIPAVRHTVAEYVNTGIAAGLRLVHLGEWIEDGAAADDPPRLLSVRFLKP